MKPLVDRTAHASLTRGSLFRGLTEWNGFDGHCLRHNLDKAPDRLPGHPQTRLFRSEISAFLQKDLCTPKLDRFSRWFWLVATQDSSHISTLTHQNVRGREIVVTEDPELHLVWHQKRIFVKPIPPFLLSSVFWEVCIRPRHVGDETTLRAALGFMRSYTYLVQHPSDFALAVEKGLIPVDCNRPSSASGSESDLPGQIDYTTFVIWVESFSTVDDQAVSARYHYGDLRLGRLNFWAKFALGRFYFAKAYGNYEAYFSRFYGPLLFVFAVFSLAMTSIQLGFNCQEALESMSEWRPLYKIGRWLSVIVLGTVTASSLGLVATFSSLVMRETIFALKGRRPVRKDFQK